MLSFEIEEFTFYFNFPAGTSRGILTTKTSWIISIYQSNYELPGVGECSVIEGLSPDYISHKDYVNRIHQAISYIENYSLIDLIFQFENSFYLDEIEDFFGANPSIRFGFEMAVLNLKIQKIGTYFENDFSIGKKKIPINGLIWMGDEKFMQKQLEEKLKNGFSTLKMKVGSIDFDTELALLKSIRNVFSKNEITLRVDANGAFSPENVEEKLLKLSELDIHSIEQPLKPGLLDKTKVLCQKNIVPIALDEELIGVIEKMVKQNLLQSLHPQIIILKPSLHGGIKGVKEWIELAEMEGIQWWMTSALESNIGLSAICQFTAEFKNDLPQGLGTGSLYSNNIDKGLIVEDGYIYFSR